MILASNFKNNIDEAFLRRMHFAIEFPRPDEEHREKIWKNMWMKKNIIYFQLPIADFRFLCQNIIERHWSLGEGNYSCGMHIRSLCMLRGRDILTLKRICRRGDSG